MENIESQDYKMFSKNEIELPQSEINSIITIKELINSLKDKISIYEEQIKKLIDDKVKLRMDMNELILQNLQSKKKTSINNNNNNNNNNDEKNNLNNYENEQTKIIISSLVDINNKIMAQNKELKEQLEQLKKNFENFKKRDKKCSFCEEKKAELLKMSEEKQEIFASISLLRKQLDELKLSEELKKEKKKSRERLKKTDSLPSIEQYFILNNKFQLVDSDKNLWHMKKCLKFQEFKKRYNNSNFSKDTILQEFVNSFEPKEDDEKSEENDYIEALNMSGNSEDVSHRKNENKYLPPLPNSGNSKKKSNIVKELENKDNNLRENEEIKEEKNDENKKEEKNEKDSTKDVKDKNKDNLASNINEIKEETSFNLSDNTE